VAEELTGEEQNAACGDGNRRVRRRRFSRAATGIVAREVFGTALGTRERQAKIFHF